MGTPIEPTPKTVKSLQAKDQWAITSTVKVPSLELDPSLSLAEVVLSRRTKRVCEPLQLRDVLSLVQFVMSARQLGDGVNFGRLRKLSISAGALHPLEVMVIAGPEVSEPLLYLDSRDTFGTVQFHSLEPAQIELQALSNIAPQAFGHYLLFIANKRHVAQAYEQPLSLLWRDAGALLQTFSLLAAALDYAFVPLGSTGGAVIDLLDAPHKDYVAVATGIIGKAVAHIDVSDT